MVGHDTFAAVAAVRGFAEEPEVLNSHFLIALSGGPDSVALLLAMAEVCDPQRLSACWVDHGLRPVLELKKEQVFVEELCGKLKVHLKIAQIPRGRILRLAADEGGVEAAARRLRYAALEDARLATRSSLILTAHTADDWLETMLMRFFSGSGNSGLRGIPERLPNLARPFLPVLKDEILLYLRAREQKYSIDSTNLGTDFLRNRIRRGLVPKVLDVFPYAPSALKTLARKASLDEDALESWAENLFEGSNLPAARFFEAPLAVRIRALYRLALKVLDSRSITGFENILGSDTEEMVPSRRIPWAFMASAASSSSSSGILGQGAGLTIELSKGYIQMRGSRPSQSLPAGALCSGFSVEVSAPGRFRIGTVLDCRLYSRKDPGGLRLDAFDWPIIIRSRRSGDKIRLVAGCRHLDRLLADMRVPTEFRDTVPLVEDRAGIVAVLGSLAGSRDIYRKNDALVGRESPGFLVLEMKGVVSDDAVQR